MSTENTDLRALLAAATPGPWGTWASEDNEGNYERGVMGPLVKRGDGSCFNVNVGTMKSGGCEEADAALIAALRNAAPDLLRVVEAVAAEQPTVRSKDNRATCGICGANHYMLRELEHKPDCAWVLARKLVTP